MADGELVYFHMSSLQNYSDYGRIFIILMSDGEKDDILCITPDSDSNDYIVRFEQHTILNTVESVVGNADLPNYLNNFFAASGMDACPYDTVQIDCPSYPSILLSRENVVPYLPVLHSQLASMQEFWPEEESGKGNITKGKMTYTGDAKVNLLFISPFKKKDDRLTLSNTQGGFVARFEQNSLHTVNTRYIPMSGIMSYLWTVFHVLLCDEEKISSVQVDCPLYPSVMVKSEMLATYSSVLFEQISSLTKMWPQESSGKDEPVQDIWERPSGTAGQYSVNFGMA